MTYKPTPNRLARTRLNYEIMSGIDFDIIVAHITKRGRKGLKTHEAARMVLVGGKTQAEALRATEADAGALWRSLQNINKYNVCRHCHGVSSK